MQWSLRHIPVGAEGTQETLRTIGGLIAASQESPNTRLVALKILADSHVSPADTVRAMRTIYTWIKRNIAYLPDPLDVELVQSPENTLTLKAGDCDDQATLMSAFAVNLGVPARLVTIGESTDAMQHIYAELLLDGQWTAADTTIPQSFGYAPKLQARQIYDVKGSAMNTLGQAGQSLPMTVEDFQSQLYNSILETLKKGWKNQIISRADVVTMLDAMNTGAQPNELDGTLAEAPTRQAAQDFLTWLNTDYPTVDRSLTGPGNLAGIFDSILGVVKSVASAIPGVGQIVAGGINLITGGGTKTASGQDVNLRDIEAAINSSAAVDLNAIMAWISRQNGAIGWLPVTSRNSFLKPPTLPMYLLNGQLSMDPNSVVPFSGHAQTEAGGANAVSEMNKQFGVSGGGYTSPDMYYKLIPTNTPTGSTGTSIFATDGSGLFSNPYILIGGSILAYLLLSRRR